MAESRFEVGGFPVVVAHRGAASTHPENTLAAFDAALRAGADVVELDVRLTANGVPVVLHDPDVSRTTDGSGLVHELPYSDLASFSAGSSSGLRQRVPTFVEVLQLVSGRGGVDLEIKNIPGQPGYDATREAIAESALREIERVGFDGPIIVCSFNPRSIARSRELAPHIPTGFLTTDTVEARSTLTHVREAGHEWALPSVGALLAEGRALVSEAHVAGVRLGTWTVDDPETLRMLFDWGVDAVATNDPGVACRVRGEAAIRDR